MSIIIDFSKSCGGYFVETRCGDEFHCFRWERRDKLPVYHDEVDCPVCTQIIEARLSDLNHFAGWFTESAIKQRPGMWNRLQEWITKLEAGEAVPTLWDRLLELEAALRVLFAHIYADPTASKGLWRGDHLSRSNIALLEKIKLILGVN